MKKASTELTDSLSQSRKVGLCIKTLDRTVLFQNSLCKQICGDVTGKTCSTGCMDGLALHPEDPVLDEGVRVRTGIQSNGHLIDAVLLNDQEFLTTIFYDKQDLVERKMESVKSLSLTRMEKRVLQLLLEGRSNKEIVDTLCISLSTVRTHLNHIYQKLPPELLALVEIRF